MKVSQRDLIVIFVISYSSVEYTYFKWMSKPDYNFI